jgi:hypothetical protein
LRLADSVVLFHRGQRSLGREASFTTRGGGSLKYLVTGLAAGISHSDLFAVARILL